MSSIYTCQHARTKRGRNVRDFCVLSLRGKRRGSCFMSMAMFVLDLCAARTAWAVATLDQHSGRRRADRGAAPAHARHGSANTQLITSGFTILRGSSELNGSVGSR
eukprot:6773686-Prymnesium_polylepis.1